MIVVISATACSRSVASPASDVPDVRISSTENCQFSERRDALVDIQSATKVKIIARAGSLRIEGRPDVSQVRVGGIGCARSKDVLDGIELVAENTGDQIFIRTIFRRSAGSLDMAIEVPATLLVDLDDSTGDLELQNLASLELVDGAGEIQISGILGSATLKDGKGNMIITGVGGTLSIDDVSGFIVASSIGQDVIIEDDSEGDITISDIEGRVLIKEDGSGDIDIRNIGGDATIIFDGSQDIIATNVGGNFTVHEDLGGDITARDIKGDFVVLQDRSGEVLYDGVKGAVSLPADPTVSDLYE